MNGWPLPAGPLREPAGRLVAVDAVVLHDCESVPVSGAPTFRMKLQSGRCYRLDAPELTCEASELAAGTLHAVAGIAEPQRFFDQLAGMGVAFVPHAFPDHHRYTAADLSFSGDAILTTEKDALKCAGLTALPIWVQPVDAVIDPDLARFVLDALENSDGSAPA